MKMKYIWKATHSDGSVTKGSRRCHVDSEGEGAYLIETWNRNGKIGGFPKWEYKFVEFIMESIHTRLSPVCKNGALKDHEIQEFVNLLRDKLEPLTDNQSLRERIASIVVPYLESRGLRR